MRVNKTTRNKTRIAKQKTKKAKWIRWSFFLTHNAVGDGFADFYDGLPDGGRYRPQQSRLVSNVNGNPVDFRQQLKKKPLIVEHLPRRSSHTWNACQQRST